MIKTRWLLLPLLIALVILPRISIDLYSPSLPDIGQSFAATSADLQMTLTIFMFGYALSMLISGPLSDLIGKRTVVLSGLSLFCFASIICALSNSIIVLILARFVQALGGCCGTVVARVMVKDGYEKKEQIRILAQLSTAMAICPLLIPILGGSIQYYFGWRMVFYFLSAFSLIILIVSYLQLPAATTKHALSPKQLLTHYKMLLTHRLFIGYSVAIGLAWCNYFAFTVASPFLIQTVLGYNSVMFGVFTAIVVSGYIIGTQSTSFFANRVGWDKLIVIATYICLAAATLLLLLIIAFPLTWQIIIIPMALMMIGVGIIIPCTQGAVMQPFPNIAGTASGLFFYIQMLFGTLTGFILQAFSQNSALPMAIVIFCSSLILIFFFYFTVYRKESNRPA